MTDKELEKYIRYKLASKYCNENIPFKDLQLNIKIGNEIVENDFFIKILRELVSNEFYILKGKLKIKLNDFLNNFEKEGDKDVN